ncbi:EAL domain-containing protein [Psychrobacter arenosus]|uniref:EAL domain-containing protein n=1 Tax=Psychrobacter arenosus TaxID=256326 RepID=UPI00191910CC|nr:bifunctional diguanylate cyclase/phosphodiesterase [Psychrobacter arenosus]
MATESTLNLLVIGDDQRYAERLVTLLSQYYTEVNLGFLDDKVELLKTLRNQWDVMVFGQAYDMTFTDVVGIVQDMNIDLPMICLMSNEMADTGRNSEGLPAIIDGNMVKALLPEKETRVVIAICLQYENLKTRRQFAKVRHILAEAEQRANILIKNSKSAVAYIDEGIHIYANTPYLELFGFDNLEQIIGVPVIDLIEGGDSIQGFKKFLRHFDKGNRDHVEFDFESRHKDGSTFEAKLQLAAATYEGEPVTQIIIQRSNADDLAKQLAEAQRKDGLTNLENRRGFESEFASLHEAALMGEGRAALLYVRLDNMGKVHSSSGLQGVDATVVEIAKKLENYFADAYVSRFSDTAFAILIKGLQPDELKRRADEVREEISAMLIEVGKRSITTTVSVGIVMLDKSSPDQDVVIERAIDAVDQVLLETQNVGNGIHLYDPGQYANSDDEALAEYLVTAIGQNRFELLYQPIYDIETDRSDFFEVYLRLNMVDGTQMLPREFMAVAKSRNLLEKIDRWMLINASKQLSSVRKKYPKSRILVPLTSASLADTRLAGVISQLQKAVGGESNALMVQFHEQDIVDYMAVAKKQILALRKVDCGVCVHNFGMTSKSVDAAEFVKPDMVRLAKSYVDDLERDGGIEAVKVLVSKASELGCSMLMPFIEDASTMSVAWSVGARYLQGYYLQVPSKTMILAQDA